MTEQRPEIEWGAVALTDDERLALAEQIRVAFDTPPDQRVIQDTWLYAAAMAEQWYVDRENRAAAAGVPMLGVAPNDRLLHECPAYMAVQDYLHMTEPLYLFNDLIAKEADDVIAVLRGAAMVERVRESRASGYDTEDQPLPLDVA